jgi:hypothetical protein
MLVSHPTVKGGRDGERGRREREKEGERKIEG